jgi:hypothetical protein
MPRNVGDCGSETTPIILQFGPQIEQLNLPLEKLGDFEDLPQRLESEVTPSKTVVSWMGLVGA